MKGVRWTVILPALVVLLAPLVLTPSVQASPPPTEGRFCAVLISKQLDSAGLSKVLHRACSDRSDAEAKARLDSVTPLASTFLMAWYLNAGYGEPHTNIYGDSGGCDSAGYRVEPSSYWKVNISAIAGFNNCNRVRVYNIARTQAQTFVLNAPNIGSYNDNVGLTQVYNG